MSSPTLSTASGSAAHHRMLGAWLVRHTPGVQAPTVALERRENGLFLLWLAFMGVLVFGAMLLWRLGIWYKLLGADPTGLTLAIIVLFVGTSLWAGRRAWVLGVEQQRLDLCRLSTSGGVQGHAVTDVGWCREFLNGSRAVPAERSAYLQVLGEHAHGPHEMAWWLNGIQLKLGLLGKVIGFSILALELGQMESFDPTQSARLLKNLTGGLGIALLTTMTGLAGNILLGLQLMRLDRFADGLVAQSLALSLEAQATEPQDGNRPTGA
ncbi:MAG: hypothetical protein RLZZ591_429 [Pseudomonadota bacterium]